MKCKCAECGITKTKFIKGQAGGGEMAGEAVGFFKKKKHDIAYSKAKILKEKRKADDEMLDEISKIPYKDRPWGTTAVQAFIKGKRKLGFGLN